MQNVNVNLTFVLRGCAIAINKIYVYRKYLSLSLNFDIIPDRRINALAYLYEDICPGVYL